MRRLAVADAPAVVARAVDHRIRPGGTPGEVRSVAGDPRARVTRTGHRATSTADFAFRASKIDEKSAVQLFPRAIPDPFLLIAATDTRPHEELTRNFNQFNPFFMLPDLGSGPHDTD